jgi:hypothetical protein
VHAREVTCWRNDRGGNKSRLKSPLNNKLILLIPGKVKRKKSPDLSR